MRTFAETADRIAATTKKLEKTALLADYLKSIPVEDAAVSAVFFSGRPFPVWEETTLQVGGTLLWRMVAGLSGRTDADHASRPSFLQIPARLSHARYLLLLIRTAQTADYIAPHFAAGPASNHPDAEVWQK